MGGGGGNHIFSRALISQKRRHYALYYFVSIHNLGSQGLLGTTADAIDSWTSRKTTIPLLNYFGQHFCSINSPCLANIKRQLLHTRFVASETKIAVSFSQLSEYLGAVLHTPTNS